MGFAVLRFLWFWPRMVLGCRVVGRALTASLYGVKPSDVVSYLLAMVGVVLVALTASAVPAARAASVDPLTALRTE